MSRLAVVLVAGALLVAGCQAQERQEGAPPSQPTRPPTEQATQQATRSPLSATTPGPTPSRTPRAKETTAVPPADQARLDRRLIAAAWDNDLPRARRLIAAGADVNAKDETEQSAYLISTSEGYLRLLELTLRSGARVQSRTASTAPG